MRTLAATLFVVSAAATASADDAATRDASVSAATATFLPFNESAANLTHSVKTVGIYAHGGAALDTIMEAKLTDKVQLESELEIEGGDASPSLEAQFDLAEEDKQGIDVQLAGGFDANGFNEVPAAFAKATVGGHVANNYVVGTSQLEVGVSRSEAAAALGLGAIRNVRRHVFAGFDSRLRLDLEHGTMEPANEAAWDLFIGPLATLTTGRYAVTAALGIAGREPRDTMASDVGAFASLGVGAVF